MEIAVLIDHVEAEGARFVDAAERAGWDAAVPGLSWTVRELVVHLGGVHRWAADAIRTSASSPATAAGAAVGVDPRGEDLLVWFSAGHADLVSALREAPEDLQTFAFLPADSPLHFWARRQAHETAMHRVDAESAAGLVGQTFDAEFARDGIDELLNGFARRRSNRIEREASVELRAGDGDTPGRSWALRFGGERIEVGESADFGWTNAMVRGTSSDVYRWLWNRSSSVDVRGDADAAALFGRTVQVSWA